MKKYIDQLLLPLTLLILTFAIVIKFNKIQNDVKESGNSMILFTDR